MASVARLEKVVKSPVINGYRNKCEFSVGHHPETNEITVGFRLASYKKGSVGVVGVQDLPIVSDEMKKLVSYVQNFVRNSDYPPLNNISQKGNWKQLTVRTTLKGDLMVWLILSPQNMDLTGREKLKKDLTDYMSAYKPSVTSLFIQFQEKRSKGTYVIQRIFILSFPSIRVILQK